MHPVLEQIAKVASRIGEAEAMLASFNIKAAERPMTFPNGDSFVVDHRACREPYELHWGVAFARDMDEEDGEPEEPGIPYLYALGHVDLLIKEDDKLLKLICLEFCPTTDRWSVDYYDEARLKKPELESLLEAIFGPEKAVETMRALESVALMARMFVTPTDKDALS